jgi:hypothetical protein
MMLKHLLASFGVIAMLLMAMSRAQATPVTFNYTGVDTVGLLGADTTVSGSMTYDPAGSVMQALAGTVTVGGVTYTLGPKPAIIAVLRSIYVYNNAGSATFDEVDFFAGISGPTVTYGGSTWTPSYAIFSFGNEASVLSSTDIPTNPLVLNQFSSRNVSLQFEKLDGSGNPTGSFSGFAFANGVTVSAVPLPASAWLLLSGVAGLVLMRRRAGVMTLMH